MKRTLAALILSLATTAAAESGTLSERSESKGTTQPSNIPVKIVVLYSSGVGYFQHAGTVHDDATSELRFKTDQINDILKSLVLQDLDHGTIPSITYPSQDPISKTLGSFQINIADNPSLHDLLNQLRGSKVSLDIGSEKKVSGTILGVEMKPRPTKDDDKKVIDLPVLNLLTDDTLTSIDFDQIHSVHLDDPELQSELTQALAALAQSRDKDKKPVTIHFAGHGDRRVSIGYVVETPIWKTSYRLILPTDAKDKPQLQGWALVENQTDTDWSDIQLSLVSGRPISFIQDLYQPLYIPRPTVQPELFVSLNPQTYDDGLNLGKRLERQLNVAEDKKAEMKDTAAAAPMLSAAPRRASGAGRDRSLSEAGGEVALRSELYSRLDPTSSVSSLAAASKLGELFQYTISAVSLPRQKSAMLPIVTDAIAADRVSIYNAAVLAKNPLNGEMLKNTTGKNLLGGPVTVFDHDAYAGDARIDSLPPDQSRLLSFGVDLQLRVNSKADTQSDSIVSGKMVKGVLYVTHKHRASQTYESENRSDHDKTLIIEHPIYEGWKLIDTPDPMEKTESLYRFKQPIAAGKSATFKVQTEQTDSQAFAIVSTDIAQVLYYARSGEIPQNVKDVLNKAAQLKQSLVDTDRQIIDLQQQIDAITNEQSRLRDNMKTVERNSAYYTRLANKLNDQETQIEKLRDALDAARKTQIAKRAEIENYLNNTSVD